MINKTFGHYEVIDSLGAGGKAEVCKLWPRSVKDFGDACLAAVGKSDAFDALATFDVAFSKRLRRQGLSTYW